MRLAVIGTEVDVTGFALAGSPGVVCDNGDAVAAALEAACADPSVAVVLVSDAAAEAAPVAVRRWQAAAGAPVVLVLPGTKEIPGRGGGA